MTDTSTARKSDLVVILREGVTVVQMVLFKELRSLFAQNYPERDIAYRAMLAGAITNSIFGVENPEKLFQDFNKANRGIIEQELISLPERCSHLRADITDALRVQTLCDHQQGDDTTWVLQHAEDLGILIKERELPLPSSFMTLVRRLGERHALTIAPMEISSEDDSSMAPVVH